MEVLSLMDFGLSSSVYPTTLPNPNQANVPFAWEDKPGVPNPFYKFLEKDFAFDVGGEFSSDHSVPAEELFDGGVIKRHLEMKTGSSSFSSFSGLPTTCRRRTQSFSTHRGWEFPWEEKEKRLSPKTKNLNPQLVSSLSSLSLSASSSVKGSRKWRFMKDLFLFRSASDGCTMDHDPSRKYSAISRKHDVDFKISSLKSIKPGTHGSRSGSGSKRRELVSAHELHYKVNRAVANDMKKRTFLPYKQGILGRSAFNPIVHVHSNGFGGSNYNME